MEPSFRLGINAWEGRDISAAALGDAVDGQRGVELFNQAGRLGEGDEGITNLVGLLADSYKKAGGTDALLWNEQNRAPGAGIFHLWPQSIRLHKADRPRPPGQVR